MKSKVLAMSIFLAVSASAQQGGATVSQSASPPRADQPTVLPIPGHSNPEADSSHLGRGFLPAVPVYPRAGSTPSGNIPLNPTVPAWVPQARAAVPPQ